MVFLYMLLCRIGFHKWEISRYSVDYIWKKKKKYVHYRECEYCEKEQELVPEDRYSYYMAGEIYYWKDVKDKD